MTDDERPEAERVVVVAAEDLSPTALRGIVEEYVTRESTDYGAVPRDFESKLADVMAQLRDGRAQIVFDPDNESIQLRPTREIAGKRDESQPFAARRPRGRSDDPTR